MGRIGRRHSAVPWVEAFPLGPSVAVVPTTTGRSDRGEWDQLLLQSEECVAVAYKAFQRQRRTQNDTPERRADRPSLRL